jgi:hypothetical protein
MHFHKHFSITERSIALYAIITSGLDFLDYDPLDRDYMTLLWEERQCF